LTDNKLTINGLLKTGMLKTQAISFAFDGKEKIYTAKLATSISVVAGWLGGSA